MAYQSKHTGANIDAGIDINTTQNNRLTALENKDTTLQNSITSAENKIKNLQNTITELQTIITDLQNQLEGVEIPNIKLNFSVKGGTSQPSNPTENTIWVNTSNTITQYTFSDIEPTNKSNGFVWFQTGNVIDQSSLNLFKFNDTEMNTIRPMCVKQYISNAWQIMPCSIYKNGKWIPWWNGYLYKLGEEYEGITGGWVIKRCKDQSTLASGTTKESNYLKLHISAKNTGACIVTRNKIDVTNYNELHIHTLDQASGPQFGLYNDYVDGLSWNNYVYGKGIESTNSDIIIDISAASGEYYIGMVDYTTGNGEYLYVSQVWLT